MVILHLGQTICLIDVGTADFHPWYRLRSALAYSAVEISRMALVRSYLDGHPDIYGVSEKICKATLREFGPEAFLTLKVYRDPATWRLHSSSG